jgi:hypothetical protein
MQKNIIARAVIAILRRVIGIILLIIGVLGLLLPILPGWPFIIPAVVLLGRRDRILRRLHLIVRVVLRWLRQTRNPVVRALGLRLCVEYVRARRTIVPAIDATERVFARMLS